MASGSPVQGHRKARLRVPGVHRLMVPFVLVSLVGALPTQRTLCPAECQKHSHLREQAQTHSHICACGWSSSAQIESLSAQFGELGISSHMDGAGDPLTPLRIRGGHSEPMRGGFAITPMSVGKMKTAELQRALRDRGLTTRGAKADLAARLKEALSHDPEGKKGQQEFRPSAKRTRLGPMMSGIQPISDSNFYDKSTLRYVPPSGTRRGIEMLAEIENLSETDFIWEVFPTQAEAFRFSDARPGFQLRVFAEDKDNNGAKKYVVATYAGFWRVYSRIDRSRKHFAEVIREGAPCKLYFDLEFRIEDGQDVAAAHQRGNTYVDGMVDALYPALQQRFGSLIKGPPQIMELDSCTDVKFSRHLIVPNVVFKDTRNAGSFVKYFAETLPPDIASCMDLGVYTRNRCFRMLHSAKYGKPSQLVHSKRPMQHMWSLEKDTNPLMRMMYMSKHPSQAGGFDPARTVFLNSLICHTEGSGDTELEDPGVDKQLMLTGLDSDGDNVTWISGFDTQGRRLYSSESAEYQRSPFPDVDKYVCNVARPGAEIQRWVFFRGTGRITYTLNRNRFCENIDRCHKSNRIMIVCDLARGVWFQKCLDVECQSINFKSKERLLPRDLFEARLRQELDPELPDFDGSLGNATLKVSPRTEELREKARVERRELARMKLTTTREAYAEISARQENGTLDARNRKAALDGAIIVSVNMTSGGHVVVKNCIEVWRELKELGFVYDLGQKGWVCSIRDVLCRAGMQCVHESEHDEGCVSRELVVQMIERCFFRDARRYTDSPAEASLPLPNVRRDESQPGVRLEDSVVLVDVPQSSFCNVSPRLRKLGFVWDDMRRAYAQGKEDVCELLGTTRSDEVTPETVLDLVARTPACDVEFVQQGILIRHPAHSEACLQSAGFVWQDLNQAWYMPTDTALRFVRAFAMRDVTTEAVLEALEAVANAHDTPRGPSPMDDGSSAGIKRAMSDGLQLSETDLAISDDTLMVSNAPRDVRESLKTYLGFKWNQDTHALVKPVEEVQALIGMDFESGRVARDVDRTEVTPINILGMLERAAVHFRREGTMPRHAYLKFEDGLVLVRECYEERNMLKFAGFRFEKKRKAWVKDYEEVEEMLDGDDMTIQNLMQKVTEIWNENGGAQYVKDPVDRMEGPSIKVEEDEVRVLNSYTMREELKALGFRWDADRRVWSSLVQRVLEQLEAKLPSEITVDALILAARRVIVAGTQAAVEAVKVGGLNTGQRPYLKVVGDHVKVYQSYDVKDLLRARGFRWDTAERAWSRPVTEVLSLLGVDDWSDISLDAILRSEEVVRDSMKQAQDPQSQAYERSSPAGPELQVDGDTVLIFKSYSVKQQLRERGFRWDATKMAWKRPLVDVMELCEATSQDQVTLDRVLGADPSAGVEAGGL